MFPALNGSQLHQGSEKGMTPYPYPLCNCEIKSLKINDKPDFIPRKSMGKSTKSTPFFPVFDPKFGRFYQKQGKCPERYLEIPSHLS